MSKTGSKQSAPVWRSRAPANAWTESTSGSVGSRKKAGGSASTTASKSSTDDSGERAQTIRRQRLRVEGSRAAEPGVYRPRSNPTERDSKALWRTCVMLAGLEAVFRCLKSALGLRPTYYHKQARVDGRLLITVLAYQRAQFIRIRLAEHGINGLWQTMRDKPS